jgi:AbrB family looped-hinge helix DNA binding protein
MTVVHSKLTSQGQLSVPAEVRRKLGLSKGSIIEWSDEGGLVVVRRAGRHSSSEIRDALFGAGAATRASVAAMDEGIRAHMKAKHARR